MPNRPLSNARSTKIASRGRERGDREPKSPLSRAGYLGGTGRRERTRGRREMHRGYTNASRQGLSAKKKLIQIDQFLLFYFKNKNSQFQNLDINGTPVQ